MKAVVCKEYGPPDVLQIKEVEKPAPKEKEVLVRVIATTVNRTDTALARAHPFVSRLFTGLVRPKNPIFGSEFAGQIEEVGDGVAAFKVGDRVFGLNENGFGSHAEYMTIAEDRALAIIPEGIPYEQAAASSEGAHYARNFLNKVDLQSGQKVLVNGATGGIGSAAVQLLRYFDANITAVCGTENMELVRSLGADEVIDYTQEDFTQGDQKYDYVFDTVGKSSFGKCKPVLVPGGIYISSELGDMAQNLFFALTTPIFGDKKVIFPLPTDARSSIHLVKKLSEEGKFKAVIDREYPLEEIVEAYHYVEMGQKIGNVVITLK